MTEQNPPDDSASQPDADAPDDGDDDDPGVGEAVAPPIRSGKRRLQKVERKRLGKWWFFDSHDPDDVVKFTVRGDRIGHDAGDAEAVGNAIQRVARLLKALGAGEPLLEQVVFGSSVELTLRANDREVARAEAELHRADELRPRADAEEEVEAALERAVADVHVAATLASDLLSASSTEAPERAARLGTDVAQAYKTLASAIAAKDLMLVVDDPASDRTVQLSAAKAERVGEALREVTEPARFTVTIVGVLSIADATHRAFGLRLDSDAPRPQALKGKRLIRGTYAPGVGASIRDQGLWGKEVKTRIRVERDALISTSTIRPPRYRLLSVEPRYK